MKSSKLKSFKVAAYCQDEPGSEGQKKFYYEFDLKAENESNAEDKADKKYKDLFGFTADTIEVI